MLLHLARCQVKLTINDMNVLDFETVPTFILTVEVSDGQLSTSATITINLIDIDELVTGLNPIKKIEALAFPNPTTESLSIRVSQEYWSDIRSLIMLNELGSTVLRKYSFTPTQKGELMVDMTGLPPGKYILILNYQEGIYQSKILKK